MRLVFAAKQDGCVHQYSQRQQNPANRRSQIFTDIQGSRHPLIRAYIHRKENELE